MNLGLQLSRTEQVEELIGVELKFLAGLDVAEQGRASNLDTLGREFAARIVSITFKEMG